MPAGFNKGQIEYIKTLANVNGHKTYKSTVLASQPHTATAGHLCPVDNKSRFKLFCLGDKPVTNPVGTVGTSTDLVFESDLTALDVYNVPIEANQAAATFNQRVTPECFLESVNMKMRHIVPLDLGTDDDAARAHKEFRLIVFRHREKQHASPQLSENRSNPLYDCFHGLQNTKYGPKGHRGNMEDEGTINYVAFSSYNSSFDRDRMLTDPMNTDDYVVMKDCRYYLGSKYGGKHIYEDRFFWNHEDPIATDKSDISYNDDPKNYCWYIMLIASNNSPSTAIDDFGYINLACNTYVTSG